MSYTGVRKDEHDGYETESDIPYTKGTAITSSPFSIATVLSLVAIILSLITGAFTLSTYLHHIRAKVPTSPVQSTYQCGEVASQAQARGCHFDLISFSWLPPACYDAELTEDFLKSYNWTWSTDPQGKNLVPIEDVKKGDFEYLFTDLKYHVVHCAYMWKKLHRALSTGDLSRVDGYTAGYGHTKHCTQMMLDRDSDLSRSGVAGLVKFPLCGQGMLLDNGPGWFRMHNGEKRFGMSGYYEDVFGVAFKPHHGDHEGHSN
ncbi:hypothetical protein N7501_007094 [Penicillium viridicatum]|nr:hypothetical protein N7501_007094 [Penicillium viridicatum]